MIIVTRSNRQRRGSRNLHTHTHRHHVHLKKVPRQSHRIPLHCAHTHIAFFCWFVGRYSRERYTSPPKTPVAAAPATALLHAKCRKLSFTRAVRLIIVHTRTHASARTTTHARKASRFFVCGLRTTSGQHCAHATGCGYFHTIAT